MGTTIRRQPITTAIPASPDYRFLNITNFGGIQKSSNPFVTSSNTSSECLNVYVDEDNALSTRPRINPKHNFIKLAGITGKCETLNVFNLHDGYLLRCIIDGIYEFYRFYEDETGACYCEKVTGINPSGEITSLVEEDNAVYMMIGGVYCVLKENIIEYVEPYIPTTTVGKNKIVTFIQDGSETTETQTEGSTLESKNILTNKYKETYFWYGDTNPEDLLQQNDTLDLSNLTKIERNSTVLNQYCVQLIKNLCDENGDVYLSYNSENINNYGAEILLIRQKDTSYEILNKIKLTSSLNFNFSDLNNPSRFDSSITRVACSDDGRIVWFLVPDETEKAVAVCTYFSENPLSEPYGGDSIRYVYNLEDVSGHELYLLDNNKTYAHYYSEYTQYYHLCFITGTTRKLQWLVTYKTLDGYYVTNEINTQTYGEFEHVTSISFAKTPEPVGDVVYIVNRNTSSVGVEKQRLVVYKDDLNISSVTPSETFPWDSDKYHCENISLFSFITSEPKILYSVYLRDKTNNEYLSRIYFNDKILKQENNSTYRKMIFENISDLGVWFFNGDGYLHRFTIEPNETLLVKMNNGPVYDGARMDFEPVTTKNTITYKDHWSIFSKINKVSLNVNSEEPTVTIIRNGSVDTDINKLRDLFNKSNLITRFDNEIWYASSNYTFHTEYNNPAYIPLNSYQKLGKEHEEITGLSIINDNVLAAYKRNKIYIITPITVGDRLTYSYTETKNVIGNDAKGAPILTILTEMPTIVSYDGIYALNQLENVQSSDRITKLISENINPLWLKEDEADIDGCITLNRLYWTYYILPHEDKQSAQNNITKVYLLDNRTQQWFYWELPLLCLNAFVKNNKTHLVDYSGKIYTLETSDLINEYNENVTEYYDKINGKKLIIPWHWYSQILSLNTINYAKRLVDTTFILTDTDTQDEYALDYCFKAWRKSVSETNATTINSNIHYVKSTTKRTMIPRFNFIQVKISNTEDDLDNNKLKLVGLGLKYVLLEGLY